MADRVGLRPPAHHLASAGTLPRGFSEWLKWSMTADYEMLAYHRPLSWYFRAIRDAGLAVTSLDEPEPTR